MRWFEGSQPAMPSGDRPARSREDRRCPGRSQDLLGFLAISALVLGVTGVAQASAPPPPPTDAVHGHYVVLGSAGDETVAYARVVIDAGYECPTVVGGADPLAMSTRDNPHGFPVIVCEAQISQGASLAIQLADGRMPLPTVDPDPKRVLFFGDTGCKLPKAGHTGGCAWGTPAEPFATLASAAASGPPPDLLLHAGDYNYRATGGQILLTQGEVADRKQVAEWPYDAGDGVGPDEGCLQGSDATFYSQNAPNSNSPDRWEAWRDDFFTAAADLLPKAPWIFARGNHELCSRAGPGFLYFLDPSSNLGDGQVSCPEPDTSKPPIDNVVLGQPYGVSLGDLTVLVTDSANACDFFSNSTFASRYEEEFAALDALAPSEGTAWLLSHRPLWGVSEYDPSETSGCTSVNTYSCLNVEMQKALSSTPLGALPATVDLVLAGHMHRFQSLTFDGDRPPVVIVGTSGVALAGDQPVGSFSATVDGLATTGVATGPTVTTPSGIQDAFAYLDVQRSQGSDWSGVLHNPAAGLTLADCGSDQAAKGSVCQLAPGVEAVKPSAEQ